MNLFCSVSTRILKIIRRVTAIFCTFPYDVHICKWIDTRRLVRCLGRPTAVSQPFCYEDYGERRVFADKIDSVFTKLRNKWKIGGKLFKELPLGRFPET